MSAENFETKTGGSFLLEDMEVSGTVRSGKDIFLRGRIVGDVYCKGILALGKNAIIEGNVECRNLISEGVIDGNVETRYRSDLAAGSVIKGHLVTSCLRIHPQAVIEKGLRLRETEKI